MSERIGGLGFELQTQAKSDAKGEVRWVWALKRFGRELATGIADTKKQAEDHAWKAFRENHEKGVVGKDQRKAWKMKLKTHLLKRPYLVAGVVTSVYQNMTRAQIEEGAGEMEKLWAEGDKEDVRVPIPSHHLALKPEQAAKQVLDAMVALGLATEDSGQMSASNKLKSWSIKHFGQGFFE